uniref:Uncharacterized protein n=1 Tax=Anopheles culicifacies TaxID=139723 RepID=A0A182MF61_9DIPT
MSAPVGGRPNIMPPAPRGTEDGYSLRPHSNSSVGQGEAELKPGTVSSERSFKPLSYTVDHNFSPFALLESDRWIRTGGLILFALFQNYPTLLSISSTPSPSKTLEVVSEIRESTLWRIRQPSLMDGPESPQDSRLRSSAAAHVGRIKPPHAAQHHRRGEGFG